MVANPAPPEDGAQQETGGPRPPDVDVLEPFGLGWRYRWRTGATKCQLTFRQFKKGTTGPSAQVTVEVSAPAHGVKGVLTVERVSLGDGNGRVKLANRLSDRSGEGEGAPFNWRHLLDSVCSRILVAQQAGPTLAQIGLSPERASNFLIEGLVEEHQATSIYGDGEVGKSWLTLAACVSAYAMVEIIPGWVPLRRVIPLYMDWETDQETMNRRVRMICRGAGIPYVAIPYVACDGPLWEQAEWLLERVQDDNIELLAVDSVEAAMAGGRAEGGDMNDGPSKMNQVLRKVGRSAMLVDHVNSVSAQSKGLAGKAYGSIFKRNWVRASYEVKRTHEGQEAGQAHVGLFNTKRNNGPRYDPRGLLWTINDELCTWAGEELSQPDLTAALSVKARMQIALEEAGGTLSVSALAELCGASIATCKVEVSRNKALFSRTRDGFITLAGAPASGERPQLSVVDSGTEDEDELPY